MKERYTISDAKPSSYMDGELWLSVIDTLTSRVELAGRIEHRTRLQAAADALNARHRLATIGAYLRDAPGSDRVFAGPLRPAQRKDRLPAMPAGSVWPFEGQGRYEWSFTAYGVKVVHRTDAAGLKLCGQTSAHLTPLGLRAEVSLVDSDGTRFAAAQAPGELDHTAFDASLSPVPGAAGPVVGSIAEDFRAWCRGVMGGAVTGRISAPSDPPMGRL